MHFSFVRAKMISEEVRVSTTLPIAEFARRDVSTRLTATRVVYDVDAYASERHAHCLLILQSVFVENDTVKRSVEDCSKELEKTKAREPWMVAAKSKREADCSILKTQAGLPLGSQEQGRTKVGVQGPPRGSLALPSSPES